MDAIAKFLKKLSAKERNVVQTLIEQLCADETKGLDIKKLKGDGNLFRIRKRAIRIIYTLEGTAIRILKIDFRNEDTYK